MSPEAGGATDQVFSRQHLVHAYDTTIRQMQALLSAECSASGSLQPTEAVPFLKILLAGLPPLEKEALLQHGAYSTAPSTDDELKHRWELGLRQLAARKAAVTGDSMTAENGNASIFAAQDLPDAPREQGGDSGSGNSGGGAVGKVPLHVVSQYNRPLPGPTSSPSVVPGTNMREWEGEASGDGFIRVEGEGNSGEGELRLCGHPVQFSEGDSKERKIDVSTQWPVPAVDRSAQTAATPGSCSAQTAHAAVNTSPTLDSVFTRPAKPDTEENLNSKASCSSLHGHWGPSYISNTASEDGADEINKQCERPVAEARNAAQDGACARLQDTTENNSGNAKSVDSDAQRHPSSQQTGEDAREADPPPSQVETHIDNSHMYSSADDTRDTKGSCPRGASASGSCRSMKGGNGRAPDSAVPGKIQMGYELSRVSSRGLTLRLRSTDDGVVFELQNGSSMDDEKGGFGTAPLTLQLHRGHDTTGVEDNRLEKAVRVKNHDKMAVGRSVQELDLRNHDANSTALLSLLASSSRGAVGGIPPSTDFARALLDACRSPV